MKNSHALQSGTVENAGGTQAICYPQVDCAVRTLLSIADYLGHLTLALPGCLVVVGGPVVRWSGIYFVVCRVTM